MTRFFLAAALALILSTGDAEACGRHRHRRHREGGCGTVAVAGPYASACPTRAAPAAAPFTDEAAAAPANLATLDGVLFNGAPCAATPGARVQVAAPCATCEVPVAARGHGRRLRR